MEVRLLLSVHLLNKSLVVVLDGGKLLLSLFLLLLVLTDPLLKERGQVISLEKGYLLHLRLILLDLELVDLLSVLLDDPLTEMRPLGQLHLHFLVLQKLLPQQLDLASHELVLFGQCLDVLRLVVQLTGQSHILVLSHLGSAFDVLLAEDQHLVLDVLDLGQHLSPQLVDLVLPLLLEHAEPVLKVIGLVVESRLEVLTLVVFLSLIQHPGSNVVNLGLLIVNHFRLNSHIVLLNLVLTGYVLDVSFLDVLKLLQQLDFALKAILYSCLILGNGLSNEQHFTLLLLLQNLVLALGLLLKACEPLVVLE